MTSAHRYWKAKESGKCVNCHSRKPEEGSLLCTKCHETRTKAINRVRYNTKLSVIFHYGGKCACCGETEISFLSIDHINNDGKKHRMSLGLKSAGTDFYQWLKKNNFPENLGLQVLCANCHLSKTVLGECIHSKKENQ